MPPLKAQPTQACWILLRIPGLMRLFLPIPMPVPPVASTAHPPDALPAAAISAAPIHAAHPFWPAVIDDTPILSSSQRRVSCARMTSAAERASAWSSKDFQELALHVSEAHSPISLCQSSLMPACECAAFALWTALSNLLFLGSVLILFPLASRGLLLAASA